MMTEQPSAAEAAYILGIDGATTWQDINLAMELEEHTESLTQTLAEGAHYSEADMADVADLIALLTAEMRRLHGLSN